MSAEATTTTGVEWKQRAERSVARIFHKKDLYDLGDLYDWLYETLEHDNTTDSVTTRTLPFSPKVTTSHLSSNLTANSVTVLDFTEHFTKYLPQLNTPTTPRHYSKGVHPYCFSLNSILPQVHGMTLKVYSPTAPSLLTTPLPTMHRATHHWDQRPGKKKHSTGEGGYVDGERGHQTHANVSRKIRVHQHNLYYSVNQHDPN